MNKIILFGLSLLFLIGVVSATLLVGVYNDRIVSIKGDSIYSSGFRDSNDLSLCNYPMDTSIKMYCLGFKEVN